MQINAKIVKMKTVNEYYYGKNNSRKLYEDEISFNPSDYTLRGMSIKDTADRLYNNLFDEINSGFIYNYITQRGTGTDLNFDKKQIMKEFDRYVGRLEFIKLYVGNLNKCKEFSKKGDLKNFENSLNGVKLLVQTLKDIKLWK